VVLHTTATVPQPKLCTPKLCAQAVHIDCSPKLMDQGSNPLCTCHIPMSIATTGLFFNLPRIVSPWPLAPSVPVWQTQTHLILPFIWLIWGF
jgi:hypothetical protein